MVNIIDRILFIVLSFVFTPQVPVSVTVGRDRIRSSGTPDLVSGERLKRPQGRKHRERLHCRQRSDSLYRAGRLSVAPTTAVAVYPRLLARNRGRRQSVADQDKL